MSIETLKEKELGIKVVSDEIQAKMPPHGLKPINQKNLVEIIRDIVKTVVEEITYR